MTGMKPDLVIMAAGMGSRYGGLKQIDPVGPSGELIIEYSIRDALAAGFGRVVFIIRKSIEADFKEVVESRLPVSVPRAYAYQELEDLPPGFSVPEGRQKPWGTTHAILAVRDVVQAPFAVINADDFYGADAFRVLARFLAGADPAAPRFCLVGFTLANTLSEHGSVSRGICETDAVGRLTHIVERTKIERTLDGARYLDGETWRPLTGRELTSMNVWGFTPAVFPLLRTEIEEFLRREGGELKSECLIPNTVGGWVRSGSATVEVLSAEGRWYGVTYPEDKPRVVAGVRELVDAGVYPPRLWASEEVPG